jgi:hypothetical protein
MTMQVAMVGTDGLILASDTRWMNADSGVRHTNNSPKIRIDHERGVAIGCARSMEIAGRVASELLSQLSEKDWLFPQSRATEIANQVLDSCTAERRDFQCLLVPTRVLGPRLFKLHAGVFNLQQGAMCQSEGRAAIAGDNVNPAVFWSERYCIRLPLQPTQTLIPLAAHLITAASTLNSLAINGLEIVLCNESGCHRLSDEAIKELTAQVSEWDDQIGAFFTSYTREFTFAPKEAS